MRVRSRKHLVVAGILPFGLIAVVALFRLAPLSSKAGRYYPGCMLYRTTGYYCGGCGGTRCADALAHGKFLQAVAYNAATALVMLPY